MSAIFFVKLIMSICFICASSTFQKLCIWNDTPSRKIENNARVAP